MPRQARIDLERHLYHVMARGIEYREIFIHDEDYKDFLARLAAALEKTQASCLAWCLLPNHFHLLIKRGKRPLSELMQRAMTGYALSFNARHKRCGHLFQNRYKAILCEEESYLLELAAYIHLNPLQAKIVGDLEALKNYRWCGHGALCGRKTAGMINREYLLKHFGRNEGEAIRRYEKFVAERVKKFKGGEYSGGGLIKSMGGIMNAMRNPGDKEMFDERVLGSGDFVESVLGEKPGGGSRRMTREEALLAVERIMGVKESEMKGSSRQSYIARGRALYCYLRKIKGGVNGAQLVKELGISSGAASYLAHRGREIAEAEHLSV